MIDKVIWTTFLGQKMTSLAAVCYERVGMGCHEMAEEFRHDLLDNDRFSIAYGLVLEGFSVIPLGSSGKRPARKWKEFQNRQPTISELVSWFYDNDFCPAIVTGAISGITVIDCDSIDAINAMLDSGVESRLTQRTTRGRHFVFSYAGERNTVRVNGFQGIDRRGEGGYVKVYADAGSWTRESVAMAPSLPA